MNRYAILYDTFFTRNSQQVSIVANEPPAQEQVEAALLAQHVNPRRIKNIRVVEIRPNEECRLPLPCVWPFTLKMFDGVMEREQQRYARRIWTGEWESCEDGILAFRHRSS